MTYTDDDHRRAVALVSAAQGGRRSAGADPVEDPRTLESMALESVGDRSARFGTVVMRGRLAVTTYRFERRRAALADGTVRNPVDLARAAGLPLGNRAARRAAARQARSTRRDR